MQNEMYFENDQDEIPKNVRRRKKQLYESIRERMEFYFSDSNLQKDRFLSQLLKNDPEVDLEIFLKFNRIHQLTDSIHDLRKALKKSQFLTLTEDKTKVFRNTPVKEKPNVDACTIYVEQLSCDADHDWLKLIFSRYGKVDYVSIPKYKNTGKIKGFAFIEFETPDGAKAALEEFEKEGCCLTNHMNPEKLCSIATFEDDKFENKTNHKSQIIKFSDDMDFKKTHKRNRIEEKEEHFEPESKRQKKETYEETTNASESNAEESNDETSKTPAISHNENEATGGEVTMKKKKNRKKKKSLKTKYKDIKMYGLQIMSKPDWKRLRNKYLNIQKEKMKKLKQHLYKNQMQIAKQQQIAPPVAPDPVSTPRFQFSKGLIVKVTFDEPIRDSNHVKQFKCDAKTIDKVEYVDVEVGSREAYVRFGEEDAVQAVMQSKTWENMSVLEGVEEQDYWEKMKRDRSEKFENKKKFAKRRGRNKIIDKTEKLMSKRIRLSVDE